MLQDSPHSLSHNSVKCVYCVAADQNKHRGIAEMVTGPIKKAAGMCPKAINFFV